MIVDSSALVALALREPGYSEIRRAAVRGPRRRIGAPTLVETGIVLGRRTGPGSRVLLAGMLHQLRLEVIPFSDDHWPVALDAFRRYGKGRHRAALNFGDCLSYAVARVAGEPLLCLGDDFRQTDLEVVPL